MIRHLRVAAVAATLLSVVLLTGCAGLGASGAADDADPTSSATTPTKGAATDSAKAGTNGGTTAAWTAKGLRAALPKPAAISGIRGYAPHGRPGIVKVDPLHDGKRGGPKRCRLQRAAYEKAGRPKRAASASYLGANPIPLFGVAVTGWSTAAAASAAMAAGQDLDLCEDENLTVDETTQGTAEIRTYTEGSGANRSWTIARFTAGSAQGTIICLADGSEHKLCNRALHVAAKKLAATEPH